MGLSQPAYSPPKGYTFDPSYWGDGGAPPGMTLTSSQMTGDIGNGSRATLTGYLYAAGQGVAVLGVEVFSRLTISCRPGFQVIPPTPSDPATNGVVVGFGAVSADYTNAQVVGFDGTGLFQATLNYDAETELSTIGAAKKGNVFAPGGSRILLRCDTASAAVLICDDDDLPLIELGSTGASPNRGSRVGLVAIGTSAGSGQIDFDSTASDFRVAFDPIPTTLAGALGHQDTSGTYLANFLSFSPSNRSVSANGPTFGAMMPYDPAAIVWMTGTPANVTAATVAIEESNDGGDTDWTPAEYNGVPAGGPVTGSGTGVIYFDRTKPHARGVLTLSGSVPTLPFAVLALAPRYTAALMDAPPAITGLSAALIRAALPPAVRTISTTNGVPCDMQGGGGLGRAYLLVGALSAGGEIACSLAESDDQSEWSATAPDAEFPLIGAGTQLRSILYVRTKRYLRAILTITGSTPSAATAVVLIEP